MLQQPADERPLVDSADPALPSRESVKEEIHAFWNEASCGERLFFKGATINERFSTQRRLRYQYEPEILEFADFRQGLGKSVLEIGVGMGCDHEMWAEAGAQLSGVDLTERAISMTKSRLSLKGLHSRLQVADAEQLPFSDESFDIVYSWGVLLYCPDLPKALSEVRRVLKPGGQALIMLYHRYSFVGFMLWARYALIAGRPFRSLDDIYFNHLESRGTRAFSVAEVRSMFSAFEDIEIDINLCHGDLLTSGAGQRHEGFLLSIARRVWPRWLIRRMFRRYGLFLKIKAKK